jgi:putative aldouronate transport system substrate-binding protein
MMNGGIEEEWDTYLENLDEIGLQRWLEINEQAVERYNNQ